MSVLDSPPRTAARGVPPVRAAEFTAVIVAVSIPGKLLEAWVVERWGRRPVIITFGVVAAVAALTFGFVRGVLPVLFVGCVMSFFGIGADPAVKVYTAESYPTPVRATGTSLTEGFGRLLSGVIGPAFIPLLLAAGGVVAVYSLVGAVALVAVVVVALFGEETKGRSLEAITPFPGRTSMPTGGRTAREPSPQRAQWRHRARNSEPDNATAHVPYDHDGATVDAIATTMIPPWPSG